MIIAGHVQQAHIQLRQYQISSFEKTLFLGIAITIAAANYDGIVKPT